MHSTTKDTSYYYHASEYVFIQGIDPVINNLIYPERLKKKTPFVDATGTNTTEL